MGRKQRNKRTSPEQDASDSSHTSGSVCMICGKTFKYEHKMKVHLRIHTGETPFSCTFCEKSFSQKAALKVHIRTHTGERPFACEECKKTFARADHLNQHIRTHTGEKPYSCSICCRTFATWSAISRHRAEHESRDSFACPFCSKTFSRSDNLRTHVSKTHGMSYERTLLTSEGTGKEEKTGETSDVSDLLNTLQDGEEFTHFLSSVLPQEVDKTIKHVKTEGGEQHKRNVKTSGAPELLKKQWCRSSRS